MRNVAYVYRLKARLRTRHGEHRRESRETVEKIEKAVQEVFSFKPAEIVKQLNLLRPIYSKTTNYGHFGKIDDTKSLTWERTDKAAALKKAAK